MSVFLHMAIRLFLVLSLFLSALLGFSAQVRAQTSEAVLIGVSLDLSGSFQVMSEMQKKGFLLWRKHVNEDGGLLGRPVRLIIENNRGDRQLLLEQYRKLIEEDQVDLLLAPYSSLQTEIVADLFEEHKYPTLASGASASSIWDKDRRYLFGLYAQAGQYAQGFLELLSLHGIDSVAVVQTRDLFSASAAQGARSWSRRLGIEVVLDTDVGQEFNDFLVAARYARESGAQAVLLCGHFDASLQMRRALAKIGWTPQAFFATVGPVSREYHDAMGPFAENTFGTAIWEYHPRLSFPGVHRFHENFLDEFIQEPNYHAAAAYAAGQLLVLAAHRIGRLDREQIRDVLATMETFSVIGRYRVSDQGRQIRHTPMIIQWQDGEKHIVWPSSLSTSEPRFFDAD